MTNNFPVRLALALLANLVAFAAFFGVARFGLATQASLSQAVVTRLENNPRGLQLRVDDLAGQLLIMGGSAIGMAFVFAVIWLTLVHLNPPAGDLSARAKRQPWAVLLIVTVLVAIGAGWMLLINAPIATQLADDVGITGTAAAVLLALLGYWLGTGLGAPRGCKVAVPGFGG